MGEIKTGEQILEERFGSDVDEENACQIVYGLYDSCYLTGDSSRGICLKCWERAKAMKYRDQGNGVYVPVDGEEE